MSQTLNNFKSELNGIMSALAGTIQTANQELSDGTKRGLNILASIEAYGVDMSREKAAAAVAIVNQRIALAKSAVNALEPLDFDAIWPAERGDTVSAVIAFDEAAENPEPDPEPETLSESEDE